MCDDQMRTTAVNSSCTVEISCADPAEELVSLWWETTRAYSSLEARSPTTLRGLEVAR